MKCNEIGKLDNLKTDDGKIKDVANKKIKNEAYFLLGELLHEELHKYSEYMMYTKKFT